MSEVRAHYPIQSVLHVLSAVVQDAGVAEELGVQLGHQSPLLPHLPTQPRYRAVWSVAGTSESSPPSPPDPT